MVFDETAGPDPLDAHNYSDVWADEEPSSTIDAAALIEDEAPVSVASPLPSALPGPTLPASARRRATLEPSPLQDGVPDPDALFPEEVTAALAVAEGRQLPTRLSEPNPPSIVVPEISGPPAPVGFLERLASQASLEPAGVAEDLFATADMGGVDEGLPAVVPVDDLGSPHDIAQTKEIPVPLSPQFLQEVAPPDRSPRPASGIKSSRLTGVRAPVKERVRRVVVERSTPGERDLASAIGPARAADASSMPSSSVDAKPTGPRPETASRTPKPVARPTKPPTPAPKPAAPTPEPREALPSRPVDPNAEPIDSVRTLKAERLFEQALKDKEEGNLVSAFMNVKLALTFDPSNELYMTAYEELSRDPAAKPRSISTIRSQAREFYEKANEAERKGQIDRAVELLEKAIENNRRAPYLNRLGVVLAMKKKQFTRAQALIEEAIELVPTNAAYERNLQKVLSMAAAADVQSNTSSNKKGGLLRGLLGRRK